jgi:hypothetical protein
MYYITNQKDQIIAMDEALLKLLGFDTIESLQKKIARDEVTFDLSIPNELTISTDTEPYNYECETTALLSMFGELSLHTLQSKESESTSTLADEALTAALAAAEEHEALISLEEEAEVSEEKETEEEGISLVEEPLISLEEETEEGAEAEVSEEKEAEEEGISLVEEPEEKEAEEAPISLEEEPFSFVSIIEEEAEKESVSIPEESEEKESEEPSMPLDEEPFSILEDIEEVEESEGKEPEEAPISVEEEPFSIIEEENIEVSETEDTGISMLEEPEVSEEKELDIGIVDEVEETLSHETVSEAPTTKETSLTPILIDVEKVSRTIGISAEDYASFLNEFIDEAISLEKDLQSIDFQKQSDAIHTLKQLSGVLHLSEITEAIDRIEQSTSEEKVEQIEILYNTLARLTTSSVSGEMIETETETETEVEAEAEEPLIGLEEEAEVEEPLISLEEEKIEEETEVEEPLIGLEEEKIEEEVSAEEKELEVHEEVEEELPEGSFGMLTMQDLDEVKPIHFDFRLEEAADELSLPVELIEEFVNDFLVQAREETVNMLASYRAGDLDRIQKIGHLLKGASSNLRINPLADTLYEIQFCEDPSQLDGLIKNYWAHFISFEKQMKMTSN